MISKMNPAFRSLEGGLFSSVEKADVGSNYQKLGGDGVALMGWADPFAPDRSVPHFIEEAAKKAVMDISAPHYTAPIGNETLKEAIGEKLRKKNNLSVDPQRNILVTPGSDSGLFYAMMAFIEPGDEVLVPSPSYPNNFQNVSLLGGKCIPVPLDPREDYQLNVRELEKKSSSRTKMLVLTHPNNPTTTVFSKASLRELADFIIRRRIILVCDQAFEDFTYENEYITPASIPELFEQTITVFSFSKGMGLSGYRVGYLVGSDKIMDKLYGAAVCVLGATNTAFQNAIIAALANPSFMEVYEKAFDYRRKQAFEIINNIPGASMLMPESGFLGWIKVSQIGDSRSIYQWLIQDAKVCVNEGSNYGSGGSGFLRVVLGAYQSNEVVVNALERIRDSLIRYQSR